jgi:hypothetical protein
VQEHDEIMEQFGGLAPVQLESLGARRNHGDRCGCMSVSARRTADTAARTTDAPTMLATACARAPRPPGIIVTTASGRLTHVEEKGGE